MITRISQSLLLRNPGDHEPAQRRPQHALRDIHGHLIFGAPGQVWPGAARAGAWSVSMQHWEDIVAIATVNPATGETVKTFDEMSEAEVERCLAAAAAAFESYRLTSFADRAGWMRAAADDPGRRAATRSRR